MYSISRMQLEEVDTICELEHNLFSSTDSWSRETIEEMFENSNWLILVVKKTEEIIGYCMIYHVLESCDLGKIAIKPEFRENRAGSYILEQALYICSNMHIKEMLLEVRESNVPAIAFYKHHGFHVLNKRKLYYHNPNEDGIVMKREWN